MKITFKNTSEKIDVNTIFCVGRNYAAHATELNNPVPSSPLIFTKPVTALTFDGGSINLPSQSNDVHYEVEVVALIGKPGKNIQPAEALTHVAGYGIGIDVTARDIQQKAKEKSHPWAIAKGFDTFAPISTFISPDKVGDPADLSFHLAINGETRQVGNTGDMLFPLPQLISYLSSIFTLTPGDLIFSGTPEGVGKLFPDDRLHAVLGDQLTGLRVTVC